jgi:hypothetical protein
MSQDTNTQSILLSVMGGLRGWGLGVVDTTQAVAHAALKARTAARCSRLQQGQQKAAW